MIQSIIREHEKYKDDPTKNPNYSFKKELKELAKDGEVLLDEPINFMNANTFIIGFDENGLIMKWTDTDERISRTWDEMSGVITRKIYKQHTKTL